jgi:hypothetical protein
VAEKLEAIAALGIANSRMKDFFDLRILARHADFDGETMRRAIRATFDRRKTTLPVDIPFGLTDDFARDTHKRMQWQAFLRKNRLEALELEVLVAAVRDFLLRDAKAQRTTLCAVTARKGSPKKAVAIQSFAGFIGRICRGIA